MNKIMSKQNGQVLLFVIVILTVSLAIGVAVSSRTLASLSRTARQDTASKAQAAAESGIELYLSKTKGELDSFENKPIDPIILEDIVSGITSQTTIKIERYKTNADEGLVYTLNPDEIRELKLSSSYGSDNNFSGDLRVCWSGDKVALYYYLYNDGGIFESNLVAPQGVNFGLDLKESRVADGTSTCGNYITIKDIPSGTTGLRFKPLYNSSTVTIKSLNGKELPFQGHKIVAEGTLTQEGKVLSTKRVTVFKPLPYLIGVFDNALYTEEEFNN